MVKKPPAPDLTSTTHPHSIVGLRLIESDSGAAVTNTLHLIAGRAYGLPRVSRNYDSMILNLVWHVEERNNSAYTGYDSCEDFAVSVAIHTWTRVGKYRDIFENIENIGYIIYIYIYIYIRIFSIFMLYVYINLYLYKNYVI